MHGLQFRRSWKETRRNKKIQYYNMLRAFWRLERGKTSTSVTFVVRAHRRDWEALLGEATDWTSFEGNRRIVERNLLTHSRRWIARRLEGSGYGMHKGDMVITLLRSERPARDHDLAWLLVPDDSRNPPRAAIDELLSRLMHATHAVVRERCTIQ